MARHKFKVGDKVRCVEASDIGYPGKVGEVLTVRAVDGAGLLFKEVYHAGSATPRRFELVKAVPTPKAKDVDPVKPHEHVVESRFEVRLDQGFGYKAITRAPRTQQEAEDFITRNGGNYGAMQGAAPLSTGPQFDIVHVEVIHRENRVRSVKRKYVPAHHELVDA